MLDGGRPSGRREVSPWSNVAASRAPCHQRERQSCSLILITDCWSRLPSVRHCLSKPKAPGAERGVPPSRSATLHRPASTLAGVGGDCRDVATADLPLLFTEVRECRYPTPPPPSSHASLLPEQSTLTATAITVVSPVVAAEQEARRGGGRWLFTSAPIPRRTGWLPSVKLVAATSRRREDHRPSTPLLLSLGRAERGVPPSRSATLHRPASTLAGVGGDCRDVATADLPLLFTEVRECRYPTPPPPSSHASLLPEQSTLTATAITVVSPVVAAEQEARRGGGRWLFTSAPIPRRNYP
nr:hypothetical protein Iba_chr03aCG7730 [Ipomoea batatas]